MNTKGRTMLLSSLLLIGLLLIFLIPSGIVAQKPNANFKSLLSSCVGQKVMLTFIGGVGSGTQEATLMELHDDYAVFEYKGGFVGGDFVHSFVALGSIFEVRKSRSTITRGSVTGIEEGLGIFYGK